MNKHGVTRDELRGQTQVGNKEGTDLIYILPDGHHWMGAKKLT